MRLIRYGENKLALRARENRQELIAARLSRRDMVRMGLLGTGGFLVAQKGLSAWASKGSSDSLGLESPRVEPFVEPLPIMPVLPARPKSALNPAPTIQPNLRINPANGLPFEGRSEPHQFRDRFPVEKFHVTRMGANPNARVHPDLPPQTFWGFNLGGADLTKDPALSPGPTVVARYGDPVLVRRFNQLPPESQNGGFGVPEVSTHLHNFHSGSESDGSPCDPVNRRFFFRGQFYDYFHTMAFAGFDSTNPPNGDPKEALHTLWYHDHRVEHTAENVYKGLAGFWLNFDKRDTGNEHTGLRLPSFPDFDVPMILTDKIFDSQTGLLVFDTFNLDGLVGDTFLVNGKVQPFFEVRKRRYRFRILDGGPSRFYELFLTNPDKPNQKIPFFVISSDGNLLPHPVEVTHTRLAVAERVDIIVDFAKIAARFGNPKRIRLENRLLQVNGRQPTDKILPAGEGDSLVEFRLTGGAVADASFDPEPVAIPRVAPKPNNAVLFPLPNIANLKPRVTRTFRFERGNGEWQVNGEFMDCTRFRFTAERNSTERWILQNNSGGWSHPIHVHLEEFRVIRINDRLIKEGDPNFGRRDVIELGPNDEIELIIRFRDFRGGYPIHCHNTVHEDHAMMLIFDVQDKGDNNPRP